MSVRRQLGDQHEVLSRDPFCSGYIDSFGKWNNGFECPTLEEEPVFCCGTTSYRYCCTNSKTETTEADDDIISQNWPLLLGVVIGVIGTVLLLALISFCICKSRSCCKKRQPKKEGSECFYAAPSTVSGITSIYGTSSSLSRAGARSDMLHDAEDILQEVDEVAVRFPAPTCRVNDLSGPPTLPRTFSMYYTDKRGSVTDSVGNTSVSTSSDNERQMFIEQSLQPHHNHHLQQDYKQQDLLTASCLLQTGQGPRSSLRVPDISSILRRAEAAAQSSNMTVNQAVNDDFYLATKM